ncbi:MAG: erythromycin esterase family protein [Sandaracinus sp.]
MELRSIDPTDRDFADLAPFAERLRGVRVVILAEPRHADADAILSRARLVVWLHEALGFDVLAWEASLFGMSQLDEALGDPARAGEDVRGLGFPRLAAGLRETRSVLDYARATRTTEHPLHVLGFDPNFNAAGELDRYRLWLDARAEAAGVLDDAQRAALETAFERFPKTSRFAPLSPEDRAHDRAGFAALRARLAALGRAEDALVLRTLDDVDALYRWHEAVGADRSTTIPWDEHVALNDVRDQAMAEDVLWQLERAPGRRVIVWVACTHASRAAAELDPSGTAVAPTALEGFVPMGEHLSRALGAELYVIAATALEGEVGSPNGPVAIGPAPEGSLEARLAAEGARWTLLDLHDDAAAAEPTRAMFVGYEPMRARWAHVYDGALFLRTMHPATPE